MKLNNRNAQISLEFAITFTFMIFVLVFITALATNNIYKSNIKKYVDIYTEYVDLMKNELIIANSALPVYERNFFVFSQIEGNKISFNVYDFENHSELVIVPEFQENILGTFVRYIPFPVRGDFCEGKCNKLIKQSEDLICINSCDTSQINCNSLQDECLN